MLSFFFFFQAEDGIRDVAVTGVQTCALPISNRGLFRGWSVYWFYLTFAHHLVGDHRRELKEALEGRRRHPAELTVLAAEVDRKSTRLNSSHGYISYAVFCLKKKKKKTTVRTQTRC